MAPALSVPPSGPRLHLLLDLDDTLLHCWEGRQLARLLAEQGQAREEAEAEVFEDVDLGLGAGRWVPQTALPAWSATRPGLPAWLQKAGVHVGWCSACIDVASVPASLLTPAPLLPRHCLRPSRLRSAVAREEPHHPRSMKRMIDEMAVTGSVRLLGDESSPTYPTR